MRLFRTSGMNLKGGSVAFSLDITQQALIDHITAGVKFPVFETAIPDADTVLRDESGAVEPYVAYQFSDIVEGYSQTFGGAATGTYWQPFNFQVVGPDAEIVRKIANRMQFLMLGFSVPFGGEVKKRMGGRLLSGANNDGTGQFYVFPASFGVKVGLFEVL